MTSINENIANHQLCLMQQQIKKRFILEKFSEWIGEGFLEWHFSLSRFSKIRPLIYYNKETLDIALNFFSENTEATLRCLNKFNWEVSHAITSTIREGKSWYWEKSLNLNDPQTLIDFEHVWHPEYQRYCEHIFNNLIRIPLEVLGAGEKDYNKQHLYNKVDLLERKGLGKLANGCKVPIRNAISHGSVFFELTKIRYIDKNETVLSTEEFLRIFDSLVDTCHSIIIALILFICKESETIQKQGKTALPLGIFFLLIDGISSHNDFEVISMVESTATDNRRQLNLSCSTKSSSKDRHRFDCLMLCWNVLRIGGEYYDRFAVSVDCGKLIPASIFINGKELSKAYQNDLSPEETEGIIESELLWFDSNVWLNKLRNWSVIFSETWKLTLYQIHDKWRENGLVVPNSRYLIREIEDRTNEKIRRVLAYVILKDRNLPDQKTLFYIVEHVIKKLKKKKYPSQDIGTTGRINRPPSYIWIEVYDSDDRIRRLISSKSLLKAEWISKKYRNKPIYVKQPNVINKNIRYKYHHQISDLYS